MPKYLSWGMTAFGLLLLIGTLLYRDLAPPSTLTLLPPPTCDLHQRACHAGDEGEREISLSITPRPVPVLDELQLEVVLQGVTADSVEVQFTGVDVDMGLLRYPLTAVGDGIYRGPAWLSVCSQRQMTWQALVRVESERSVLQAPFRFDTVFQRGFSVLE